MSEEKLVQPSVSEIKLLHPHVHQCEEKIAGTAKCE